MSQYDDIIHLPHHVSPTRKQMSIHDRAAQFSPFAALTGHGAAVEETARLTEDRIELSDDSIAHLSQQLGYIGAHLEEEPTVSITYFVRDAKKSGGAYVTHTGTVRRIDEYEGTVIMHDKSVIAIAEIVEIAVVL